MPRYVVISEASLVTVEARSSVHPIARSAPVSGTVDATVNDQGIDLDEPLSGRLELALDHLGGDGVLDREIAHRIDAARYPIVVAELQHATPDGHSGRYRMSGLLTFHGRSCIVGGEAQVRRRDDATIELVGTMTIDVREFGIVPPKVLVWQVDPEIDVALRMVATRLGVPDT